MHLLDIEQRRQVVVHRRDVDAAGSVPVLEAGELVGAGALQIAQQRPGGLAGPAVAGLGGIVVGRLDQVERLADEIGMLPEADILIVREADIGVRMVAHIDRPDGRHGRASHLPFLACWPPRSCRLGRRHPAACRLARRPVLRHAARHRPRPRPCRSPPAPARMVLRCCVITAATAASSRAAQAGRPMPPCSSRMVRVRFGQLTVTKRIRFQMHLAASLELVGDGEAVGGGEDRAVEGLVERIEAADILASCAANCCSSRIDLSAPTSASPMRRRPPRHLDLDRLADQLRRAHPATRIGATTVPDCG